MGSEAGKHDLGKCKDVFALLSEYLDAELTPESCGEIEKHLAGCPPCIEFLQSLKKSIRLCHECPPCEALPPLNDEQKQQLLAAYRKSLAGRKSR